MIRRASHPDEQDRFKLPSIVPHALYLATAFLAPGCDKDDSSATEASSEANSSSDEPSTSTDVSGTASTTGTPYPEGSCFEVLDSRAPPDQDPHPADSYWACAYWCGIDTDNDTFGLPLSMARMSYDLLQPGQPDGCYELRTALYQCVDDLTCAELAMFRSARNMGTDGPCTAEYYALEPHIPECGI